MILGSFHMVPKGKVEWIEYVRPIYDWADVVYLEMQAKNAKSFPTTPGKVSAAALPVELRKRMAEIWPSHAPPLVECSAVYAMFLMGNVGIESTDGVEPYIEKWAGDGVLELETPKEFLASFDDVPAGVFAKEIGQRIGRTPQARKRRDQIYRAWRNRDADRIAQLLSEVVPPELWEAMFVSRNRAWSSVIADASKSSNKTLIVCGCGHLCGPGNLLQQLKDSFGLESVASTSV